MTLAVQAEREREKERGRNRKYMQLHAVATTDTAKHLKIQLQLQLQQETTHNSHSSYEQHTNLCYSNTQINHEMPKFLPLLHSFHMPHATSCMLFAAAVAAAATEGAK